MNSFTPTRNGLSARRKAIQKMKRFITWASALTIIIMLFSCNENTKGQDLANRGKDQSTDATTQADTPRVSINVKRHYDEQGNLIGVDSTYSSFYSSIEGDTSKIDSIIKSFDRYFNRNHSSFFREDFNSLFFNDSIFYPDFFNNDFFMKRYEQSDDYLKDMMRRMDSVKNHFYKEHEDRLKDSNDL